MNYTEFLKEEMLPAFGCTEPIAIAYASARASKALGRDPEKITIRLSGNMIKNANSVTVPGTEGRKGIPISVVAGAFLGDPDKKLEVLNGIDKSKLERCDDLIDEGLVTIVHVPNIIGVYVEVIEEAGEDTARVVLERDHTNITLIEKNGEVIFSNPLKEEGQEDKPDLNFEKIYDFAKNGDLSDLEEILDTEIEYNYNIAVEGMTNDWGSSIGKTLAEMNTGDYFDKLASYAAAGSDARMSGCEKPVVINSGSGNQGITMSVPIIVYAKDHDIGRGDLYRGLVFGNLISLYMKQNIGKLSAYCGAVSASSGAFAGIAFLDGAGEEIIKETISNNIVGVSGIICDGAKPSCAMKIAASLRNSALAYRQAKAKRSFVKGDGIVKENIDQTIDTVGTIAKEGMKETDEVILKEMIKKN